MHATTIPDKTHESPPLQHVNYNPSLRNNRSDIKDIALDSDVTEEIKFGDKVDIPSIDTEENKNLNNQDVELNSYFDFHDLENNCNKNISDNFPIENIKYNTEILKSSNAVENLDSNQEPDITISMVIENQKQNAIFIVRMHKHWYINESESKSKYNTENVNNGTFLKGEDKDKYSIDISIFGLNENCEINAEISSFNIDMKKGFKNEFKNSYVRHEYAKYGFKMEGICYVNSEQLQKKEFRELKETIDPIKIKSHDEIKSVDRKKKYYFRLQDPKIYSHESSNYQELSQSSKAKYIKMIPNPNRYDFSYKLPQLEFPCLKIKNTSDNLKDADANDISNDDINKRYDFRYQLPKFDINSLGIFSEKNHNLYQEPSIPDKRHDFRFQLPNIEVPFFSIVKTSSNDGKHDEPDIDANVQLNLSDEMFNIDENDNRFDFRFPFPTFEMPSFEIRKSTTIFEDNVKVDIKNNDTSNIDDCEKRFDFRFQLPQLELPSLGIMEKFSSPDQEKDPKIIGAPLEKSNDQDTSLLDFRFDFPSFELPSFGNRKASKDLENNVDIDIINNHQANNDDQEKRFDFRFKLPSFELPSFGMRRDSKDLENDVDVDIKNNPQSKNDNQEKRFDFRFQLPSFELPSFGIKKSSSNLENEVDVDISNNRQSDSDAHEKRFDFKINLPQFEFPSFLSKEPSIAVETIEIDSQLKSSDKEYTVNEPETSFEFRFPFSKMEFPSFGIFSDSIQESDKHDPLEDQQIPNSPVKRFDFSFKLPDFEFPRFGVQEKYVKPDTDLDTIALREGIYGTASTNYSSDNEHSDIDLYPSPIKIVKLPNFSPLVSIRRSTRSRPSSSDSDRRQVADEYLSYNSKVFDDTNTENNLNLECDSTLCSDPVTVDSSPTISNKKDQASLFAEDCQLIINTPLCFNCGYNTEKKKSNNFTITFKGEHLHEIQQFHIQLENNNLTCQEYYLGYNQLMINHDISNRSSNKDFQISIVPESNNKIKILLDAELIVEYRLKGTIENLKRVRIEGLVERNEVT